MINPVELILKKRSGGTLSHPELKFFIEKYLDGSIPEYQMSALLMAIYFKGMTPAEAQTLTEVYIASGVRYEFPSDFPTVDKHSTGGVGDKITIMLAPIVAACGANIPMLSGRGLGHTGGTLDKLEAIPGLRTDFDETDFRRIMAACGFSIISQSAQIVPADKRIYALRDVTATVESIGLITASIMSKKIAEGAKNLVLDLKVGSGAFIKNMDDAYTLGKFIKLTGENLGQKVSIIYTDMNAPLGQAIGNSLEIIECIEYLKGKKLPDIDIITKTLAREMLALVYPEKSSATLDAEIKAVIDNGAALEKFREFIELQGGNPSVCDDYALMPSCAKKVAVKALETGNVEAIDSQAIGYALIDIGAGRKTLKSPLNYGAGAQMYPKIGDTLTVGETIGYVYADTTDAAQASASKIAKAYKCTSDKVKKSQIIIDITK